MTLWTAAPQAPLSRGFSRQEYWNGSPCSPPGDLPDPGTEPASLMSLALAGEFFTTWEAQCCWIYKQTGLMNVLCEYLYVGDLFCYNRHRKLIQSSSHFDEDLSTKKSGFTHEGIEA